MIDTLTGNGFPFISGDGGPALAAGVGLVRSLAFNDAGDLFLLNDDVSSLLRKIDMTTGVITTVAGGGASMADAGPGTSINIGRTQAIAADGDDILIGGEGRVWCLDTDLGLLTAIAGTGVPGYGGDGGAPLDAQFNTITGLAVDGLGGVYIADSQNHRVRYIQPDLTDLFVTIGTSQVTLDGVSSLAGSLVVIGVEGRVDVVIPNLESVGEDVLVENNADLETLELPIVTNVGGGLIIVDNGGAVMVDLGFLTDVGGDLTIDDNDASPDVTMNTSQTLFVIGDATLGDGTFDLPAPVDIGGQLNVNDGGQVNVGGELSAALINVQPGGELGGSGEIDGPVENQGLVSPGESPGKLVTGPFTQTADGLLLIEIAGLTAETEYDVLHVMGDALVAGVVQFEFLAGFEPAVGDEFGFLIADGAVDFSAASFVFVNAPDDLLFSAMVAGGTLTLVAVPEPTSTACWCLAVGGAVWCARRSTRRKAKQFRGRKSR